MFENMSLEELRECAVLIARMRDDLEAIQALPRPSEDTMKAVADYRADLEAIDNFDLPNDDIIALAAKHRADLEAIERDS